MRNKRFGAFFILRFLALALIFSATLLLGLNLISYSRLRGGLPAGLKVAGVNVGGLSQEQAANRIIKVYSLPVEINYQDAVFQINPSIVGFDLDIEAMLTAGDLQRLDQPFWDAFWDYLWGRLPEVEEIPLRASLEEDQLRQYLKNEISPRYDLEAIPSLSLSGSSNFDVGQKGTQLDIERSIPSIRNAFFSASNRSTTIYYSTIDPGRPSFDYLHALLQRNIEVSSFEGIAEFYLLDLSSRDEIHFALDNGEEVPPDIAFTAASTMKIPIMLSTFIDQDLPLPDAVDQNLIYMIEQSENTSSDRLMEFLGGNLGPLVVTENMQVMGFENTFIAGYYYFGAPLLRAYETPANSRNDIFINPDPYNQTVSSESGMLLDDLYQCAEFGGGTLLALYPDQITQGECQQMIAYLANNEIGVLIQAGLPDGTKSAHKHGWITEEDGLIHTISDVGIIYSPGGNYVLCIYLWHPVQLFFDDANLLFADLSQTIYNYFNIDD
ncbi:MAG: class A beta-lactamase-related serine hydrolase [Anaerolineaceae bacterium]|nr:class A beta-lactamase-related serine hydrolase [Anaerolineaceae bacterium]